MTDLYDLDPEEGVTAYPVTDERSLARRIALQALYEIDSAHHPTAEVIARQLQAQRASARVGQYMQKLVYGTAANLDLLDDVIRRYAPEWPLEQIAIIDRNILRMAIFEFALQQRTPVSVAIDEAVELAKMFGAEGASAFVNGVLGALADDEAVLQALRQQADEKTEP